jgi:hypothetical protein
MFQGKQTVLDFLRTAVPVQADLSASKRSGPSLFEEDEDFAPPPPRKISRPMALMQRTNASSAVLSSASDTVIRSPVAVDYVSGSRLRDEVLNDFMSRSLREYSVSAFF